MHTHTLHAHIHHTHTLHPVSFLFGTLWNLAYSLNYLSYLYRIAGSELSPTHHAPYFYFDDLLKVLSFAFFEFPECYLGGQFFLSFFFFFLSPGEMPTSEVILIDIAVETGPRHCQSSGVCHRKGQQVHDRKHTLDIKQPGCKYLKLGLG